MHQTLPQQLADLPQADVMLLGIPFGVREPYYEALRSREVALYVEKPIALTLREHRRLCDWFADSRLACGFQRRLWAPTQLVRRILADRLFGGLREVRFGFGDPGIVVSGKYSADPRLASGGILAETAVHGIDALLYILDATSVRLDSVRMICDGGFDLHTEARLSAITSSGEIDWELKVSCLEETINQLEFICDTATFSYSLFGDGAITVKPHGAAGQYVLSPERAMQPFTAAQTFHAFWSLFLSGVRTGQVNETAASQSLLTTAVLEGLYEQGRGAVLPSGELSCAR
jgi:predicted dehydrogenase